LVGFRFIYGLRNAVPFAAGMSGVSPRRFVPLNAIGAAIWAPAISLLGYAFGQAVEHFLDRARRYEEAALLAMVLAGLFLYFRRRKQSYG
jgi:membrane protein DedA with SNARE-associated domain